MNKTLLIARREVMAYVKTVGFWLSLLSLPFFAVLGAAVPMLMKRAEPVHAYVLIDEANDGGALVTSVRQAIQGKYDQDAIDSLAFAAIPEGGVAGRDRVREAVAKGGFEAGLSELKNVAPRAAAGFTQPRRTVIEVPATQSLRDAPSAEIRDSIARDLVRTASSEAEQELSAVVILTKRDDQPSARIWTRRASNDVIERSIGAALEETHRQQAFKASGVDMSVVERVERYRPAVTVLSPRAASSGGEVSLRDRLPALIGMMSGFMLWSLILTGATMLMNGVMEEKSNKILEVLLSSVTSTELLAGKVLGVAILTLTVMGGWALIAFVGLGTALPDIAKDVWAVMLHNGLIFYLILFLIGGYLMYAVLFAAIGAFCETPRDAQTLMGPVMMALVVPLLFMQMALRSPDAVVLKVLSLIPPFTPFIMAARMPSEPPLIEIIASIFVMFAFAALMMWLSGRAFRAGAMSDAKLSWKAFLQAMRHS